MNNKPIPAIQKIKEAFKKLCVVTLGGDCKYWKLEELGYTEEDEEAARSKFFPQDVWDMLEPAITEALLNEQERIALKAKLDMERILNDFEYIFAPDGYIRGDRRFVLGNMKKWLKQQLNRLAELKRGR